MNILKVEKELFGDDVLEDGSRVCCYFSEKEIMTRAERDKADQLASDVSNAGSDNNSSGNNSSDNKSHRPELPNGIKKYFIKGYKITDKDGFGINGKFKYEVSRVYVHHGSIYAGEKGFHFCLNAVDCQRCVPHIPSPYKYFEVSCLGKIDTNRCFPDTIAADVLRIEREISYDEWNEMTTGDFDNNVDRIYEYNRSVLVKCKPRTFDRNSNSLCEPKETGKCWQNEDARFCYCGRGDCGISHYSNNSNDRSITRRSSITRCSAITLPTVASLAAITGIAGCIIWGVTRKR